MKSYFMNNNEFQIFENIFPECLSNGTGTILKNCDRVISLPNVIQQEITLFKQSKEAMQLTQRAILIDYEGKNPPTIALEECTATIQSQAPNWSIQTIKKRTKDTVSNILDIMPKTTVMNAAVKAGLLNIPKRMDVFWGIVNFILTLIILLAIFKCNWRSIIQLSAPSLQCFGLASCIAAVTGILTYFVLKRRALVKTQYWATMNSVLKEEQKSSLIKKFISIIANKLVLQMPLVIVVEDIAMLDDLSADVIKLITMSEDIYCVGAILWICFQSKNIDNDNFFSNKISISLRRYSVQKILELKK